MCFVLRVFFLHIPSGCFTKLKNPLFFRSPCLLMERERGRVRQREREEINVENESIKQIECFLIDLSLIDAIGEH